MVDQDTPDTEALVEKLIYEASLSTSKPKIAVQRAEVPANMWEVKVEAGDVVVKGETTV